MYQARTKSPWLCHYGFNMMVDFCVWVLEKDGLQITPFDAHSEGNAILRNAGLQIPEWKSWIANVVNLQYQHSQILKQHASTNKEQTSPSLFLSDVYNPHTVWLGTESIKECLYAMWEQYKPLSKQRRIWEKPIAKQWRESGVNQQLWTDLQTYDARLPSLTIHLVEYPQPVDYLIPPTSIILTTPNGNHLGSDEFRHRVLNAVECLLLA